MLPRWHILLGFILSLLIWAIFPEISLPYICLIFASSVLIDFDHYMCAVLKTGKLGLFEAFRYHEKVKRQELLERKRGIFRRGDFHIFHTIEFHIFVFLLSFLWAGFFYIFVGMFFHSFSDIVDLIAGDRIYRREFFLTSWLVKGPR